MAFPTIPTTAASRILSLNQANTTATRTFPNLSGLTKNAGDLLIAIVVGYQTGTGTNAAFSGWSAGWTEFHDSASSTTLAIGMAYKWSTGSETGAITVTQAGTITGHASMMLLSIPGAHATTPPEAGSRASGTGAANPASFDPSGWASEDTLWIAVGGSGEDSASGTWTGMGSAPTNYSNYADTATSDTSTVGQTELAVAFRQLNASSEDVGAFTGNDTSNARDAAVIIAVRPKPSTITPVAEISLASHATPPARTNHTLKIRARTTSGSTGVIKAALYEGSTNRSGDLTSSVLTTSLADYALSIPEASATNITDYSNLTLKIWGYDDAGNALVFEVANAYLELPAATGATTYYGVVTQVTTFNRVTSAQRKTFSQTATPITFSKAVAGNIPTSKTTPVAEISLASHGTPSVRTNHSIKIRARSTTGSTGVIKAALYEGSTNRSGDLTSGLLGNTLSDYTLVIPDAAAATITDYSNLSIKLWGYDAGGNALVFEIANVYLTLPVASVTTYYGATSLSVTFGSTTAAQRKTFGQTVTAITFGKDVRGYRKTFSVTATSITFGSVTAGQRKTFSGTALPLTFSKDVRGYRKTFGQLLSPYIFGKDVSGSRKAFGQIAFPITFASTTAGNRLGITYFGVVARPITFGKDVSGSRKTFSQVTFPITFGKDVRGQRKAFGQIVFPITFGKAALGTEISYGATSLGIIFGKEVAGRRKTFSQSAFPVIFGKEVIGRRKTFSSIAFPITIGIYVVGVTQGNSYGSTSMSIIFGKDVSARRKTFGQLLSPYIFAATTQAKRRTVSQIVLPITFVKDVSGRRKTFGQVARPIGITIVVSGSGSTPAGTYYGVVARPITFGKAVETGRILTHGQITFPTTVHINVDSRIIEPIIVLNLAENLYLGEQQVVAVYTDGQLVWSLT